MLKRLFGSTFENLSIDIERQPTIQNCKQQPYRLTVTSKNSINSLQENCQKARLPIKTINLNAIAIAKMMPFLSHYDDKQDHMLCYQTGHRLLVVIERQEQCLFAHHITLAAEENWVSACRPILQWALHQPAQWHIRQLAYLGDPNTHCPDTMPIQNHLILPIYRATPKQNSLSADFIHIACPLGLILKQTT